MITELLGLAGSGIFGSVFGIVSDVVQRNQNRKTEGLQYKMAQEARLHGQTYDFISSQSEKPHFRISFGIIVFTYCLCCIICLAYPEAPIHTFNPDDIPKRISILWGLFTWERKVNYVYTISSGGVGYALLHPLAFQIGTVITGIKASK